MSDSDDSPFSASEEESEVSSGFGKVRVYAQNSNKLMTSFFITASLPLTVCLLQQGEGYDDEEEYDKAKRTRSEFFIEEAGQFYLVPTLHLRDSIYTSHT